MADNSNNRKKTLIVSVLAFLLAGGGVFLFFVVQGSNELTGKGKKANFTYGTAAREGVSSFFKSIGVLPDEEALLAKKTENRMSARGFLPDGSPAAADISDWMSKPAAAASASARTAPSSPTNVPKMAAGSPGTFAGGGGGSKSAGSVTRFGGESATGVTSVNTGAKAGASGTTDKGTLGTLKSAKAVLGEGLRSNSAMTAQAKWNQSFGVGGPGGGGKSGDLAYNKTGLVNLDKIKSGEIASLKPSKTGTVPDAGAFERDKEAEKKDSNLQAAREEASEKSKKDQEKKEMAKALAEAGTNALGKSDTQSKSGEGGEDPSKAPITDEEKDFAKDIAFFKQEDLGDGASFQDTKVDIVRNPDGSATYNIHGVMNVPGAEPQPYVDKVIRMPDGSTKWVEEE